MKVLYVSPFPEDRCAPTGGVESVVNNIIHSLLDEPAVEIFVIAPFSNSNSIEKLDSKLTIFRLKKSVIPGFISSWTYDSYRIAKIIKCVNPDVVHYQGFASWATLCSREFYLTIHGVAELDILYRGGMLSKARSRIVEIIERYNRRRAKKIVVINPYVENLLKNVSSCKLVYIPNPVSEDFFKNDCRRTTNTILYMGRISRLKNIHHMLNVFHKVHLEDPSVIFRVCGSYESENYYNSCANLVEELDMSSVVTFTGALNRAAVLKELRAASCLVLLSSQEVSPMVIQEAMASSVPVVCSDICGIKYLVRNEVTGYLVDVTSEDDAANRIIWLVKHKDKNITMGDAGFNMANKYYRSISIKRQLLKLYGD